MYLCRTVCNDWSLRARDIVIVSNVPAALESYSERRSQTDHEEATSDTVE